LTSDGHLSFSVKHRGRHPPSIAQPIAAPAIRARLLSLTGDPDCGKLAISALTAIDNLRDDYGAPMNEPHHPDLA
jgi:hypothetical protein